MTWKCDERLLDELQGKILIVFGAGRGGRFIAEMLATAGYTVNFFADNDKAKQGTRLSGVKILAPREIQDIHTPYLILSSILPKEMEMQFRSLGISMERVVDMRSCIRGYVPLFLQPFYEGRILSRDTLRFLVPRDLEMQPLCAFSQTVYDGALLYLRGFFLPATHVAKITVSVNGEPEENLQRIERPDLYKASFYFDTKRCGFEGVTWIGDVPSVSVKVMVYAHDMSILAAQEVSNIPKSEISTLWQYILRKDSEDLQQKIYCLMNEHEAVLRHRSGFALRYCQILYFLGKTDKQWFQAYRTAIEGIESPVMRAWGGEHELPWILFCRPDLMFQGWHHWRRQRLMQFARAWFGTEGKDACQKNSRVVILLDGLGNRLLASAVFELSIARELTCRDLDIHIVVQDACSPVTADALPIFSRQTDSSRYSKDHQSFVPASHIHYCKRDGYTERMHEAYNIIRELVPAFIIDISGWGTILSAALHENGWPVIRVPLSGYSESAVFDRYISKNKAICVKENETYHSIPEKLIFEAPIHVPYDLSSYPTEAISDTRFPGNAFIMVTVGNRLQYELREDFLLAIKKALAKDAQLCWCVVAPMLGEKFYALMQEELKTGQVIEWGHEENLPALYKKCSVYVNPDRMGGGGSITMAMDMGMPVAMTKYYTDITPVIGLENCFEDYAAMFDYVLKLKASAEFYSAECDKMKERVSREELTMKHYVDVILQAWEDIKKRGRWSWRENCLVRLN